VISKLNLASQPFRNRTLPYLVALTLLALAGMAFVYGWSARSNANKENELALKEIKSLEQRIAEVTKKGEDVEKELAPEDRLRLIAAHKLVANRSFGWSRLFADLEGVLPGNVSASRIVVENIFRDGDQIKAELDLAVLSRDYQGVSALIDNMNNSGIFRAALRSQDLQKTDRLTFTEYTLRITYAPTYTAPTTASDPLYTQNQEGAR
jgi:Tfp pilus assembly protein PilN